MANKNFPGPNINRLIDKDPQIVKISLDQFEWGTRMSLWKHMPGDPAQPGGEPGQPKAPEIMVKHIGSN